MTAQTLELCSFPLPGQLLGPSYPPEGSRASTSHITALSPGKRAMRSGSEGRDGFTKRRGAEMGGGKVLGMETKEGLGLTPDTCRAKKVA